MKKRSRESGKQKNVAKRIWEDDLIESVNDDRLETGERTRRDGAN